MRVEARALLGLSLLGLACATPSAPPPPAGNARPSHRTVSTRSTPPTASPSLASLHHPCTENENVCGAGMTCMPWLDRHGAERATCEINCELSVCPPHGKLGCNASELGPQSACVEQGALPASWR